MQSRLLLQTIGVITSVWIAAISMVWWDTQHELDELLDAHLAHAAAILVTQQAGELEQDADDHDRDGRTDVDTPLLHKYAPRVAYQVFHDGHLSHHSANSGHIPMSSKHEGFSTETLDDGNVWRVFVAQGAEHGDRVYVAERMQSRDDIMWAILRSQFLPFLFALPILAAGVWVSVRQGMRPLVRVRNALMQESERLEDPIWRSKVPKEIEPLIAAIVESQAKLKSKLEAEARFTSDAAHELRTPIAAMRAHAQVIAATLEPRDKASKARIDDLLAACDRSSRLIEQLLALARLDSHPGATTHLERHQVRVDQSLVRVSRDLASRALQKGQRIELLVADDQAIEDSLTPALFESLIRNVLDNAIRYTPTDGQVLVKLIGPQQSAAWTLIIEDSGPGLSDLDLNRLGERFFRVIGHGESGSGLGWSIIKRICSHEGLQINATRSEKLGGLLVSIWRSR